MHDATPIRVYPHKVGTDLENCESGFRRTNPPQPVNRTNVPLSCSISQSRSMSARAPHLLELELSGRM
jgi:hypothetical protein